MTLAAAGAPLMSDLLVILATASLVTLVFSRLRVAAIPAYLVAGAIIGEHAFDLVGAAESIEAISHIAIILLMFGIGLHMETSEIKAHAGPLLGAGIGSTLLVAGATIPASMLLADSMNGAIAISIGFAMSSTAAVLRLLHERRELQQVHGRLSVGILLIQDLLVIGALAILPLLAPGDEVQSMGRLVREGAITIGVLTLVVIVGRRVLPRLMRLAARGASDEALLVLAAAIALGAAALTERLGLSAELGAFIAGFILASTPFRHEVSGQLSPMRDLFMAVFFTSVGLELDLGSTLQSWHVVLGALAIIVGAKLVIIWVSTWAVGASPVVATKVAFGLAQAGEFSLIVAAMSSTLGIIDDDVAGLAIAVVVFSLMCTPVFVSLGQRLAPRFASLKQAPWCAALESDEIAHMHGHVIIAGFGPIGRAVTQKLEERRVRVAIVELNAETVDTQQRQGRLAVYGDITNRAVLESAGVRSASAVVLTIPDDDAMLRACRAVRAMSSTVMLFARSNVLSRGLLAAQVGATHVTVEEIATAEALARQVMDALPAETPAPSPVP
ncbi:MAG: cation:proton antiporter [Phycisphaerales bacterium]|nr:cation:proton antiporter [Phycisphaerales bacterium]